MVVPPILLWTSGATDWSPLNTKKLNPSHPVSLVYRFCTEETNTNVLARPSTIHKPRFLRYLSSPKGNSLTNIKTFARGLGQQKETPTPNWRWYLSSFYELFIIRTSSSTNQWMTAEYPLPSSFSHCCCVLATILTNHWLGILFCSLWCVCELDCVCHWWLDLHFPGPRRFLLTHSTNRDHQSR